MPVKSKVEISQNFVAFSEYMNFTIHYKSKFPKKFLAELVFLYIDSILLWNQDWLIDWVEFNQHCRSWRLRLRATPIWKMLQCTMGPKHFFKSFLKSYSSLQVKFWQHNFLDCQRLAMTLNILSRFEFPILSSINNTVVLYI